MPITIDGKTYTVPGVYGTTEIINLGSVALPAFNNLLIIGSARRGMPSTASGKKGYEVIKAFSSVNSAKDYYGKSPLTDAMEYAKAGGAGVVHLVNIASITRASAIIKDNAVPTPANCFNIVPQDKFWGAPGNDIAITMATATSQLTLTILPPKLHKFLTANASTSSKEITLENVEGLAVGQTVKIVDGTASSVQSTTIAAIDVATNKVTLGDLPASAYATSGGARIFQEDTDKQETKTFESDVTVAGIIDWINSGQILTADRSTYTGIVPETLAKTYLGLIASATKGTSPVATETSGGDFDTFAESAALFFEEYTNYTKTRMRILCVLSSEADVHAVYKTLALDLRNNMQYSVQVVVGVADGDIDLAESNADHPIQRAKTLNNNDIILCGMGIDDLAAYISSAPLVAGMISGYTVKRNLTNDIVNATKLEKFFGEYNKLTETKNFVDNGVLIFGTGKNGFFIVQGVNTYQNHSMIWNEQDKQSYLIQQRGNIDYVYEGYKLEMENGVGADGYTPQVAAQKGLKILEKYLNGGFITKFRMLDAWQEGNAVYTKPEVIPVSATDFVGFILSVLIEN